MSLLGRSLPISEAQFNEHVFTLAAQGGWHGLHIRRSHNTLEGLHSPRRPFPRGADHDDASGLPDLLLVHPDRGLLLLPELKTARGRVSGDQERWIAWLSSVRTVLTDVWRPQDEDRIRGLLLG